MSQLPHESEVELEQRVVDPRMRPEDVNVISIVTSDCKHQPASNQHRH